MTNRALIGILLCFLIAFVAWLLGHFFPLVGGAVFGILLGMLIASIVGTKIEPFRKGINFSGKKILQYSIILLGFEMNITEVITVGMSSLQIMFFTITAAFLAAWLFSKILKIDSITATLIGVGTAICGGSAIAATAPIIKADDKAIAYAISTIFLFNIIAVFIFPLLGHLLKMSNIGFGIWAGTAINDTSSVLAASFAYSHESGTLATIVKLTRTLMIIPITFALSIYVSIQSKEASRFNLLKAFPYFIIGFIVTAIISTSAILPIEFTRFLALLGKFLIVVAMVGIGLNTHLGTLIKSGIRPILLGLICWMVLAVVSLIIQYNSGLF